MCCRKSRKDFLHPPYTAKSVLFPAKYSGYHHKHIHMAGIEQYTCSVTFFSLSWLGRTIFSFYHSGIQKSNCTGQLFLKIHVSLYFMVSFDYLFTQSNQSVVLSLTDSKYTLQITKHLHETAMRKHTPMSLATMQPQRMSHYHNYGRCRGRKWPDVHENGAIGTLLLADSMP